MISSFKNNTKYFVSYTVQKLETSKKFEQ